MLRVSDKLFLFVSAGCVQLQSHCGVLQAILLTAAQLVYTKILISSQPNVNKCLTYARHPVGECAYSYRLELLNTLGCEEKLRREEKHRGNGEKWNHFTQACRLSTLMNIV